MSILFDKIEREVRKNPNLNSTDKIVYITLKQFKKSFTDYKCKVFVKQIAEEVGKSVRTIQYSLKKLSREGYIIIKQNKISARVNDANTYYFTLEMGNKSKELHHSEQELQTQKKEEFVVVEEPIIEDESIQKIKEIIPIITNNEAVSLLRVSQNNVDVIRKAYEQIKSKVTCHITNLTGFLINVIRGTIKLSSTSFKGHTGRNTAYRGYGRKVSTLKNYEEEKIDYDKIMAIHKKLTVKDLFI